MFARRVKVAMACLVLAHVAVWSSGAKVYADVREMSASGGWTLAQGGMSADAQVAHDKISISLPVFISSLLATVGSTWYIASLYHEMRKKNALMAAKLAQLEREVHGDKGEDKWDGGGSDGR